MKLMKIIVSPAKKMKIDDIYPKSTTPQLLEKALELMSILKEKSLAELKAIWRCSDKVALHSFEQIRAFNQSSAVTAAIFAYDGIQYQHISASSLTETELAHLEPRLCILSGLYGLLRPFDLICPYRLEMQAQFEIFGNSSIYAYWADTLANLLSENAQYIINLASLEYSRAVTPYIPSDIPVIACVFGEESGKGIREKATLCKMARGEMVRFIAQQGLDNPEQLKEFTALGFTFSTQHSTDTKFVFVK